MNGQQKRMKMLKQQRYEERRLDSFNKRQAELAMDLLTVIPVYVLHEEFGFGEKRIEKFLTTLLKTVQKVADENVSLSTLANIIDAETGVKYDEETQTWTIGKTD